MARPTKKQSLRKQTERALYQALSENGLEEKFYQDQVAEYMKYYDNLEELNKYLENKLSIDYLKEKRQVTKEMRSILAYLGFKPGTAIGGEGGFEEL